jgi:nicotinamide-nucleotide adenylyltransferase
MGRLMMDRFQYFHLNLVKQIFDDCVEIITAITKSQFNYLEKDPASASERMG